RLFLNQEIPMVRSVAGHPERLDSLGARVELDDGSIVRSVAAALAEVSGNARSILTAERVALNFLQRMCGIATATAEYVKAVSGTGATILDTRKTVPGLRMFDKYSVRVGGGANHRVGLFDGVLVKDNHIAAAGSIREAVTRVRRSISDGVRFLEVECETVDQVGECLELGVDLILLDNMTPDEMAPAVKLAAGRAKLEASGNVTLQNVREIAETGVDYISVGSLTHSVTALDIGLDIRQIDGPTND
ncbi:MAG: carboxylating nicotinate-nucleotide diphosphorylase, partial [Gammaproteobacteria bacterium]|nr:carboxylating nicotinate-nucleotide diphosphorylase [Gammaproteobacteria bacterium]